MLRIAAFLFIVVSVSGIAQTLTPTAQKSLNDYVAYANKSGDDARFLFDKITSYYGRLRYFKKKTQRPVFSCGEQLDEYYYKQAIGGGAGLSNATVLRGKAQDLQQSAEKIDGICKALDTYHKLEDYQRDDFKQADELIIQFQSGLV
jgi:hypothetical protein